MVEGLLEYAGMKKWLFIVVIVLAITPIALNIMLGATNPFDIGIVGNNVDWLSFYGSYLGGVIAAIIAFVTMWQTSKHNTLSIMIQRQETYIENLSLELGKRISKFEFWNIGKAALINNENLLAYIPTAIEELNNMSKEAMQLYNSYGLLHSHKTSKAEENLNAAYFACIKQYNERIRQMTGKLKHLESYKDTNSFKLDMKRFEIELDSDKHYKVELFNKANELIREEEEKLDSLIKANKKLFPSIPKFK